MTNIERLRLAQKKLAEAYDDFPTYAATADGLREINNIIEVARQRIERLEAAIANGEH